MPIRPPPATPPGPGDVSDRAARNVGIIYGSDGFPLASANSGRLQVDVITGGGAGGAITVQEDTTLAAVSAGDAANKAVRVNLVAGGGAGGGSAQLQVYDGAAWQNVRDAAESATVKHVPTKIMGSGANPIEPLNGAPAGTEYALPTRNIPGGTQAISAVALPLPAGAAADATLTGGTAKAIVRGGAKGTTVAADVTSTASGVNHNGADVVLYDAAGNVIDPRVIRALTATDVVTTVPPANASTNVAQLAGTTPDTNSGLKSAGTLRVVLATDQPALTNKLLVTPDSVALPANQSVNAAQFGGSAVATGVGAGGAGVPRVTVSNDSNVIVTPPTLTKGTQGATGFSTQDLKDSGRVNIMWTAEFSPTATAEALLTLTESRDGAATTTFTTKVVTSGKRLRITSISMQVENTLGTSLQRAYLRMRFNTAGAVTTASPLQSTLAVQALGTVKSISVAALEDFPDGVEYLGDGTKQIGFTLTAPDWVSVTSTLKVYVTIFGFEF